MIAIRCSTSAAFVSPLRGLYTCRVLATARHRSSSPPKMPFGQQKCHFTIFRRRKPQTESAVSSTQSAESIGLHSPEQQSGDSRRRTAVELPREVSDRLGTLKNDVIECLLRDKGVLSADLISSLMSGLGGKPLQLVPARYNQHMHTMAKYYFAAKGGKLIRPTVSLLMSLACNQIRSLCPSPSPSSSSPSPSSPTPSNANDQKHLGHQNSLNESDQQSTTIGISLNQYRIAMVAEMIHNATLVHDDVIDESVTRRGQPTVNARWGNKQAVLVGDFILARATKVLCSIGEPRVIETMAEIVEDLVKGELLQLNGPAACSAEERFNHYMLKTFYKTGSLFANSCRSVAMLSESCNDTLLELATEFGRNLGLAFQLVDDILDYCATEDAMGKPSANDLRMGLATCPVLFAADQFPELNAMIERRFARDGDVQRAMELVHSSRGLDRSRQLAKEHGERAIQYASQLLPEGGVVRDCLVDIVRHQLGREG